MSNDRNKAVFNPEAIAVVATDVDLTLYPADKAYFNACFEAVQSLKVSPRGFFNKRALKDVAKKHGLHKGREVPEHLWDLAEEARRNIDPDFIAKNPPLVAAFQQLAASDVEVFVMSHSNSCSVARVLEQVGFSPDVMPFDHRLTSDVLWPSKREVATYKKLFDRAPHLQPDQFVLMDDSRSNLRAAHEAGLQTIWISDAGTSALEKPDYVGLAVKNPIEGLSKISAARRNHAAANALCA